MVIAVGTLGAGAQIDTARLIDDLVAADRAPRTGRIEARQAANTVSLSALGQLRSAITGLSGATTGLVGSGRIGLQPTSSDSAAIAVSVGPSSGAAPVDISVEVRRLASEQVLTSNLVADPLASLPAGRLLIRASPGGAIRATVDLAADNGGLVALRDAINAANGGVTASLLAEGNAARLVLRGDSGAAQAFVVEDVSAAPGALAAFAYAGVPGAGLAQQVAAVDAELSVGGIIVTRPSNRINDAIDGIRLDLRRADPGTMIRISGERDPASLTSAVSDFVDAVNETAALTASLPGGLAAARAVRTGLSRLPSLAAQPGGVTLADLGVRTNRDGTLTLDTARLATAAARSPLAVDRLFSGSDGLAAVLARLQAAVTGTNGLAASAEARLRRESADLARAATASDQRTGVLRASLTRRFADMDRAVGAYRATETFLQQQIDAWTASRR